MTVHIEHNGDDQRVGAFIAKCNKAENFLIEGVTANSDDAELDTLVFLLKLVRARRAVVSIDGLEGKPTPAAKAVTRKRWTPAEEKDLVDCCAAEQESGIVIREDLVKAVAAHFPDRTPKSVEKRLYGLGAFEKKESEDSEKGSAEQAE